MKDWQNDPRVRAAVLEGIAGNQAYPTVDRLDAALHALRLAANLLAVAQQIDRKGGMND